AMNLPRRQFLHFAAGAAVLPVASIASAQAYPSRPITIVAPFAAGGPVDARTRILAEHMRQTFGQSVIVENVTGAAGSIGVGRVAHSVPDGYTIVVGIWGTHVVNGAIYTLTYAFSASSQDLNLQPEWQRGLLRVSDIVLGIRKSRVHK